MKSLVILALCLLVPAVYAQERTASGNLATEASWQALKSLSEQAKNQAQTAHIRLNQMEKCNRKGLLYAAGVQGSDSDGCVATQKTSMRWSPGLRHSELYPPTTRYYGGIPGVGYPQCSNLGVRGVWGIGGVPCNTKGLKCEMTASCQPKSDNNNGGGCVGEIFTCD